MNTIQAKARFAHCLMNTKDVEAYNATVLYVVFKTIEANENITLNQLRWQLGVDFMLKDDVIDAAVASLTNKSLFNCIGRFQPQRKKMRDSVAGQSPVHLRVRPEIPVDFSRWLGDLTTSRPELSIFCPRQFVPRSPARPATQSLKGVAHVDAA